MSDSLRDQLLNAGFAPSAPSKRSKQNKRKPAAKKNNRQPDKQPNNPTSNSAADKRAQEAAAIAQRKAVKAAIRTLIEANQIADYAGEVAYRYTMGSRIKQLFVKEEIRVRIIAEELVITRLNGTTQLVTPDIADQIHALNPNWAIVRPGSASAEGGSDEDASDEYADYQVPDDLQW